MLFQEFSAKIWLFQVCLFGQFRSGCVRLFEINSIYFKLN
jgi:hypothetical protein